MTPEIGSVWELNDYGLNRLVGTRLHKVVVTDIAHSGTSVYVTVTCLDGSVMSIDLSSMLVMFDKVG